MKTAIAIPTLNASGGCWQQVLRAVDAQDLQPELKLIVDSGSEDGTCESAREHGWVCLKIHRRKFDHGGTRSRIVKLLHGKKFDAVVFLTQDVVLNRPDSLRKLIECLEKTGAAGCFGRQLSEHSGSLHEWQRKRCYPAESYVRTLADAEKYGMMTAFFSDAFGAWNIPLIAKYGAFPETEFGEDALLAAKVLLNGESIAYCAEAECLHEHRDEIPVLWSRGRMVGKFHRTHRWLLKSFGMPKMKKEGKSEGVPVKALFSLAVKTAGYVCGRFLPF